MSIMIEKLKNQLENLDVKYNSDVDIFLKVVLNYPLWLYFDSIFLQKLKVFL